MDKVWRLTQLFNTFNENANALFAYKFLLKESQTELRNLQFKRTFDSCVSNISDIRFIVKEARESILKNKLQITQVNTIFSKLNVFVTNLNAIINLVYNELQNQHKIIQAGNDPETIYKVSEFSLYNFLQSCVIAKKELLALCDVCSRYMPMNTSQQKYYLILKNKLKINPPSFTRWSDPIFDASVKMKKYEIA